MTDTNMPPSNRRLMLWLGLSLLLILPSVSGNILAAPRSQQNGARRLQAQPRADDTRRSFDIRSDGSGGREPDPMVAEKVVREQAGEEQVAAVARALDKERRDAYRRQQEEGPTRSKRGADSPSAEEAALITPPPVYSPCLAGRNALGRRQNDGQVQALSQQIQSLSQQLNSCTQASRDISQSSQQLSQSSQQLAQSIVQLVQSTASLQAQVQQAQSQAQQAQDQARQASDAAARATASADSAIASASSSAETAIASAISSAASSASSVIASVTNSILSAASLSANQVLANAASQVQAAKADATLARNDANIKVEQAQGAAVSVTQAALAVVATFLGSSLLSIAAFWLILRYRRKRSAPPAPSITRSISAPSEFRKEGGGLDDAYGSTSDLGGYNSNGYPIDVKQPPISQPMDQGGDGYSGNGGGGYAVQRASSDYGTPVMVGKPPAAAATRFSLFPKKNVTPPIDVTPAPGPTPGRVDERASATAPSLEKWLMAGTVSPFVASGRTPNALGPAAGATRDSGGTPWPFYSSSSGDDSGSAKKPMVGLPKPKSGGGPMMQPRTKLPFRDSSLQG